MNAVAPDWFPDALRSRATLAEPLARHTSWHVGGPADVFFRPASGEEFATLLAQLPPEVPVLVIGLGSNLLVRDGGWRGVVVSLHGALDRLEQAGETLVYAEAGVPCARLARSCVAWKLGPAEFFAGIPGTVGGALAMNAGAWGGETWPLVATVEVVDRAGRRRERAAAEYRYGYRHVAPPAAGEWFLGARLKLEHRPQADAETIQQLLDRRRATQPIGAWSGGSTFVNPPGLHAARLIDTAGLKGYRVGGASVSTKHANFIVNDGSASARDIESLIGHVQEVVLRTHGVRLVTEIRIVGEAP